MARRRAAEANKLALRHNRVDQIDGNDSKLVNGHMSEEGKTITFSPMIVKGVSLPINLRTSQTFEPIMNGLVLRFGNRQVGT